MSEESEDLKRVMSNLLAPAAPHLRPSRVLPLAAIAAVVTVTVLVTLQGPALLSPRVATPGPAAPAAAPLASESPAAPVLEVTVRSPEPNQVTVTLVSTADHEVEVRVGGQTAQVSLTAHTRAVVRLSVTPGRHRWSVWLADSVVANGAVTVEAPEPPPVATEPSNPTQPSTPRPTKKPNPKPKDTPIGSPTPVDPED